MLSYLELKNFKSFSNVKIDLRGPHNVPKKTVFIYGENGSGKSNLMLSFLFLCKSTETLRNQEGFKDFEKSNIAKVLADEKDADLRQDIFKQLLKNQFFSLSDLISEYKSLMNNDHMSIELGFYLNGKNGSYHIVFDNDSVIFEELKFQISERVGTMFSISAEKDTVQLSPSTFINNEYRNELLRDIEKYWGKHTFLGILYNEIKSKNLKFIRGELSDNLLDVLFWISKISILCKFGNVEAAKISTSYPFLRELKEGVLKQNLKYQLIAFEKALNSLFTHLYSDIKKVYYKLTPIKGEYKYELYFKKQIDGLTIDIPVSLESTGTQKLLEFFPLLFCSINGSTVLIDEIDSGIHDLLMLNIIEFLKEFENFDGQFIATTHNTLLMSSLKKDDVYIISSDSYGNKEIICINDFEFRTQKNNNIQKKYLSGEYGGIPYTGYLDLEELSNDIKLDLTPKNKHKQN